MRWSTPIASLFFILLLLGGMLTGCKKDDDFQPPSHVLNIPSALYFQAIVDGVPYTLATDEGSYSNTVSYSLDFKGDSTGTINLTSSFLKPGSHEASFEFRNFYYGDSLMTDRDFMTLFGIGKRDYYRGTDSLSAGVILTWKTPGGQVWTSKDGEQPSQIFNVDQNEFGYNSLTTTATLSVSFSCTLYDENGNPKPIEEGKAVIYFTKPVF